MPLFPPCLLGPMHVHPRVSTPEDYRQRQRDHIAKGRRQYPFLMWPNAWKASEQPIVFVAEGQWKVCCLTPACQMAGDHPSLSVAWRLAICLNCGAVYEDVAIPPDAAEIERVLMQRLNPRNRNWNWPQLDGSETVADLERENVAHGADAR